MGWVIVILIGVVIIFFIKRSSKIDENRYQTTDYSNDNNYNSKNVTSNEHHRRKNALNEIRNFLEGVSGADFIVFDTETNGLDSNCSSILSISAIKFESDKYKVFSELDRFNRYYFPREPYNEKAISINGLNEEEIIKLRGSNTYPRYFNEDEEFKNFCRNVNHFVGHNIGFDANFVPFVKNKRKFDTMKINTDIVCSEWMESRNSWKWPTLKETAYYYGISYNESSLHGSMYDSEITFKIFIEMVKKAGISFETDQ